MNSDDRIEVPQSKFSPPEYMIEGQIQTARSSRVNNKPRKTLHFNPQ